MGRYTSNPLILICVFILSKLNFACIVCSTIANYVNKGIPMRFLLLISTLILTACSSTQGLSVYSLSNSDLETVLDKQLPSLSKELRLMGLPVKFDVNALNVKIGPENRKVLELALDSSAEINAYVFKYPVGLKLTIEAKPFYDSKEKAIFVQDIKLLDSSIDAGGYAGDLRLLDNEVMSIINVFLSSNPVYRLNMNDPKIALLSKLPLNIEVVEGTIKLVPSL